MILSAHREDQRIIEEVFDLLNSEISLRASIKEMEVHVDLINEVLLHIEGYYPLDVAGEISDALSTINGDALGQFVLDLVAPGAHANSNYRIPKDVNWVHEMIYQVSLAYERICGQDLLLALRSKGVSNLLLEEITFKVFGNEVAQSAKEIYDLLIHYQNMFLQYFFL